MKGFAGRPGSPARWPALNPALARSSHPMQYSRQNTCEEKKDNPAFVWIINSRLINHKAINSLLSIKWHSIECRQHKIKMLLHRVSKKTVKIVFVRTSSNFHQL